MSATKTGGIRLAGVAIVIAATLVIIGWVAGIELLVTWVPGESRTVVNTAACMLLGGVGVLALDLRWSKFGMLCGALINLISGATLLEYVLDRPLGIDGLFWKAQWFISESTAGRMAITTALALFGMGTCLLLLASKRTRPEPVLVLGGLIVASALPALLVQLSWLIFGFRDSAYKGMATPTALCLVLLAGVFLVRARAEVSSARGSLALMAAAVGMLVSVAVMTVQTSTALMSANRQVTHTFEVRRDLDYLDSEIARVESSARAFALTGAMHFREGDELHREAIMRTLDELQQLVSDHPGQLARLDRARQLVSESFAHNAALAQARISSGAPGAADYLRAQASNKTVNAFASLIAEMQAEETRLLVVRDQTRKGVERSTRVVQGLGTVLALGLLGGALLAVRHSVAARRESDERFRYAFEFAGIGMAIVGLDGRWIRVNERVCQIVGYSEAELLKKTFQDITHPEDLNADMGHVQDLLDGKQRFYQMQKRYLHRDGHLVWIHLTASLVRDAAGRPVHFVSQIEDVTDRRRLEAGLAQARDEALQASRLKSQFLANMSHEIRTPMNGVIGMTDVLLDSPLTPEQRNLANTVRSSADLLLAIINDILDFSKIEAGQLTFDPLPFDLGDPVETCLSLVAEKAHAKKLELAYLIEENVPTQLIGDSGRLHQVLLNLVSNAVKFTAAGEVVLTIAKVSDHEGRVRLRFSIRDTGIGIDAAAQKRLFQPFAQADGSTTRKFGGTGLGLAICKHLVALMGGEIGLESAPGHGSTFWFTAEFPQQEVTRKVIAPRTTLAGQRALIVDDNDSTREILLRQMRRWEIAATTAGSASTALERLREAHAAGTPFDFVVLDLQLREMPGLELARSIRDQPVNAAVKMILLTSTGQSVPLASLETAGVSACLVKPVREAMLHDALLTASGRHRAPDPNRLGANAPVASDSLTSEMGRLRILLAEDNLVNQHVARMQLAKFGYEADIVSDGAAALQAASSRAYDVVLMDCNMPVMDGFEATRRIRMWEDERRMIGDDFVPLQIVAMTANAMEGDRESCLAAGMNDYVSKPVRSTDLAAALAKITVRAS